MIQSADVPRQVLRESDQIDAILDLIRRSFADMEGRIDPPSSMHRLTAEQIRSHCNTGEVWTLGAPPYACIFLSETPEALYVGKLAVDAGKRGRGIARQLIDLASARARAKGRAALELDTRIELVENHAAFRRLGFEQTGHGAHDGHDRPTFITLRKLV